MQKGRRLGPFRSGSYHIPFSQQAPDIRFQYLCLNSFCFRTHDNAHPVGFTLFRNFTQPDPFLFIIYLPGDTDIFGKRKEYGIMSGKCDFPAGRRSFCPPGILGNLNHNGSTFCQIVGITKIQKCILIQPDVNKSSLYPFHHITDTTQKDAPYQMGRHGPFHHKFLQYSIIHQSHPDFFRGTADDDLLRHRSALLSSVSTQRHPCGQLPPTQAGSVFL